jgi:AraC family transcriptional activator of pobA
MQKSGKSLRFSAAGQKEFGSASLLEVPRYALYGDEVADLEEMIHLEPVGKRCRERGWIVAPHTHPRFTQIIVVTEGNGDFTLEGDVLAFAAPCALIIPPFRIHGFRYAENSNGWVLTIQSPYLNDLLFRAPEFSNLLGEPRNLALHVRTFDGISANLKALESELSGSGVGRAVGIEICTLGIFLALLRTLPASFRATSNTLAHETPIDQLGTFIEAHYREQPSISDMAAELGMTTAKLRNVCKVETGLSPLEMLHDRIIFEAKRMLVYTSKSVSEIGAELGFHDPAYFNRFFLRFTRCPPKQYRSLRQSGGAASRKVGAGDG